MKRMKKSLYALLFSCTLLAGSVSAAADTAAADQDAVKTEAEVSDRNVSITVSVKKDSKLTSGRVIVYYNVDEMTLENASVGNVWDVEDINTDYTEGSKKGVAVAWASAEENKDGGKTATINFLAKDSASGKEVVFETVVDELYVDNTPVDASAIKPEEVKVQIGGSNPSGPSGSGDSPQGSVSVNNGTTTTTSAAQNTTAPTQTKSAKTGDNANFANMLCLLAMGCVVLAYAARKQMSALHVISKKK